MATRKVAPKQAPVAAPVAPAPQAGKGLKSAKAAAKAPSAPVVTPAPQAAAPAAPAPSAPAPQPAPQSVAVRGGSAIQSVKLTGKQYRVGATHNQGWWQIVQATVTAGGGQATVAALVQAKVPATFIGYTVRRGYLQSV